MLRIPRLPRLKKPSKRQAIVVFLIFLIALVGLWFWRRQAASTDQNAGSQSTNKANQKKDTTKTSLRLIATGDFVPHDSINAVSKKPDGSYNYLPIMQNLKPFFDASDLRFCNQAVPAGGSTFGITGYPVFNSPTDFSRDMAGLGCNVINTASNHSFDKGQAAINATLNHWDSLPNILAVAGANRSADEQNRVRYFEVSGVKFAFLAYTTYNNIKPPTTYGVNQYSKELAGKQLAEAKTKADIIIVSMRWGTEYSSNITSFQDQTAQYLADNGANIVLGHGPHVLQPIKVLKSSTGKDVIVWYSLGNFINAQIPLETLFGCMAVMDINIASKTISNISCLPFYMHYEWTVAEKAKEDLLKRHDFKMYLLDNAADPLAKSQNKTTVEAERQRITDILNKFTQVKILHDSDF